MPTPFSRTLRALDEDARGFPWALLGALALVAAWFVWFVAVPVAVHAATDEARVESARDVHPVQAVVGGRVVGCRVALGATVRAGDVICELQSDAERSRLSEERARREALTRQLAAIRIELSEARGALERDGEARRAAIAVAVAEAAEAEAASRQASDAAARFALLRDSGGISELEFTKLQAAAESGRALAEARRLHVQRLELEQRVAERDRLAALQRLERESAELSARIASTDAGIAVLEEEIERRQVRAPVAGRIGELAPLRPGAVVSSGDRLAAIVPDGDLRVVAEFAPAAAVGRLRAGQPARVRLAGFPSSQYGTLRARVMAVAMEPRGGRIRAELAVVPDDETRLPLRHGLPGRVEVELERVSPATLVLRAAGRLVTRQPLEARAR